MHINANFAHFEEYQVQLRVIQDISRFSVIRPVSTIGIFDGVHLGHAEILRRINQLAASCGGESVVITLWPHPRTVLHPQLSDIRLLTTLEEKISLISGHGIQHLVILPFTKELSSIPFDRFVKAYLVDKIRVKHLVVGFNHHFGKDRKGSFENLQRIAGEHRFTVERLDPVIIGENRVSSSGIRHMIEKGRIRAANDALGYPYFMNGKVIKGNHLGRVLGYPTANLTIHDPAKLIPPNGVYAVKVLHQGKEYQGMMSIGIRPTLVLKRHEHTIEVHIFDFADDLYGQELQVQFYDWMRCERKFSSLEDLKEQLEIDKREVLKLFRAN